MVRYSVVPFLPYHFLLTWRFCRRDGGASVRKLDAVMVAESARLVYATAAFAIRMIFEFAERKNACQTNSSISVSFSEESSFNSTITVETPLSRSKRG